MERIRSNRPGWHFFETIDGYFVVKSRNQEGDVGVGVAILLEDLPDFAADVNAFLAEQRDDYDSGPAPSALGFPPEEIPF